MRWALAVAVLATTTLATGYNSAAAQEDADMAQCLQERVTLENISIERNRYNVGRDLTIDVTNELQWAISGVMIGYEVRSEGRSVPWEIDSASLSIPGGIEPGETRQVTTTARVINDAPEDLLVTAHVMDVADPEQRQLVRSIRVIGWADEISDRECF